MPLSSSFIPVLNPPYNNNDRFYFTLVFKETCLIVKVRDFNKTVMLIKIKQ